MKTSILARKGVSPEIAEMISRLVALIPWPYRRQAMGDVALTILNGKPRIAEKEFGWTSTKGETVAWRDTGTGYRQIVSVFRQQQQNQRLSG